MIRSGAGAYAKTLGEYGAAGVHCKPRPRPRLTLRGTHATLRAFAGHALWPPIHPSLRRRAMKTIDLAPSVAAA